jgi:glycosyltransferase 2 family protein
MHRLQSIFLLLGIALFVFLVQRVGPASILHGLYLVGWSSFFAIFVLELLIDALHSEGWRWCLPAEGSAISRLDVFLARTAGVAVNVLTPTASVGGEVVKGMLLRRWVPLADGFASVMVDKLTFAIGQTIFLMIGIFALLGGFVLSDNERAVALLALVLWIAAVAAFFLLQRAGIFRVGVGAMRAMFGGSMFVERLPGHAAEFDEKVATFLRRHHLELAMSVLLHLLAQLARVPQLYLALSALGLDPTLSTSLTTAAGLVFIEATLFLIPARLGVFEGGSAGIFLRLGYSAADGIVVAFVMRLSELGSVLLGLGALAYYHFRPWGVSVPNDETSQT